MAKFGRMDGHRNADRFLADTYGLLYWIFDAEVVRVEISLGFVVSLRPKAAAFGQAGSTRLDYLYRMQRRGIQNMMYDVRRVLILHKYTMKERGPGTAVNLVYTIPGAHGRAVSLKDALRAGFA